jgi:hypothetical protein
MSRSHSSGAGLAQELDVLSRTLLEKLHRNAQGAPRLAEKETPRSPHAPEKRPGDRDKPITSADPGMKDLLKLANDYLGNPSNRPEQSKIQSGLALTDKDLKDTTVSKIPPVVQKDAEGKEVKGDDRTAFFVKEPDGSETPITVKDIRNMQIRPQ